MRILLRDLCDTIMRPWIKAAISFMQGVYHELTIKSYFKTPTFKSEHYLNYIRSLDCVSCNNKLNPVEAHHEGLGIKAYGSKKSIPDSFSIPLCIECHVPKRHTWGYVTFWNKVNLDPKMIIIDNLTEYLRLNAIR
jgi:hypothetical protein